MEKFLFKKVEVWIVFLIIIFGIISLVMFGAAVRHQLQGGERLGQLGVYVDYVAAIPQTLKDIASGRGSKSDLLAREQRFGGKGGFHFNYPPAQEEGLDYLLLNKYDGDLGYSVSELWDLSLQKKVHTWKFNNMNKLWRQSSLSPQDGELLIDLATKRYRNQHAYLTKSGEIFVGEGPLISIGLDSSLSIVNDDVVFHHSLEADENDDFWVPIQIYPQTAKIGDGNFHDNGVMKISQSGEVQFKKSVIDILDENNLGHLVFGAGEHNANNNDPIHLNDIQPVEYSGKYWKKGDVFLSIRNLSLVLLYRPESNKVLWFQQGPWLHQHDVNIVNNHEISIYNNNVKLSTKAFEVDGVNNIYVYNFDSNTVYSPWKRYFEKLDIRTITEGRAKLLGDRIFIEESDYGRLLLISRKNGVLWSYVNRAKHDNSIYRVNWSRIIPRKIGDKIKKMVITTED